MRNYFYDGMALEQFLISARILTIDNNHLSLVDLIKLYAESPNRYIGPTITTASVVPPPKTTEVKTEVASEYKLSDDQKNAWLKIKNWAYSKESFFVLKGYAGTGKSYLLQLLKVLPHNVYYSAPTNKAAKVVTKLTGKSAKTIYSLLGLRMEQVENKLVLNTTGTPQLKENSILVVDEASMCGEELCRIIYQASKDLNLKVLFVGDPAQLPPVGEPKSSAWGYAQSEYTSMLKQVMRYDNELLALATKIRENRRTKNWVSPIKSNHSGDSGIWRWRTQDQFERNLLAMVQNCDLSNSKVIAWRNKTVAYYNQIIRRALGFKGAYCVGDLILLAAPIEKDGLLVAHTDDEYKIENVSSGYEEIDNIKIDTWNLSVVGDQSLYLTVPKDQAAIDRILAVKANIARRLSGSKRKAAWADFWEVSDLFNKVRYGYALTAHRAQGSTYTTVHIDQYDILANPNKREAFSCLYVAATRPTHQLFTY